MRFHSSCSTLLLRALYGWQCLAYICFTVHCAAAGFVKGSIQVLRCRQNQSSLPWLSWAVLTMMVSGVLIHKGIYVLKIKIVGRQVTQHLDSSASWTSVTFFIT